MLSRAQEGGIFLSNAHSMLLTQVRKKTHKITSAETNTFKNHEEYF
jgi:hypothetical protein